jgi:hypothetical protein
MHLTHTEESSYKNLRGPLGQRSPVPLRRLGPAQGLLRVSQHRLITTLTASMQIPRMGGKAVSFSGMTAIWLNVF